MQSNIRSCSKKSVITFAAAVLRLMPYWMNSRQSLTMMLLCSEDCSSQWLQLTRAAVDGTLSSGNLTSNVALFSEGWNHGTNLIQRLGTTLQQS